MTAPDPRSTELDEFLAKLAPTTREALEALRATIAAAAPEAVEGIA